MGAGSKDLFSLQGRTIAVIGAGSGIGRAIALGCAGAGARVLCWDIDARAAVSTAELITAGGGWAATAKIDVTNRNSVDAAFAGENARPLSGVVCTPGVNVRKLLRDYSDEEIDRVLQVNIAGAVRVLRAANRALKNGGSIVLFSSIRSLVVEPGQSVYAASKAGIVQLARTAAVEMAAEGIRVNTIAPGVVDTPLTAPIRQQPEWYGAYAEKSALGRWGRAEEMAGPAVFLLSDAASYVTGAVLFVDGGWTAVDGRFWPPGMSRSLDS